MNQSPKHTLAEIGEFGLIQAIRGAVADATVFGQVLIGPGDDTAVVAIPSGKIVITTDMLVEGRHFRCDWSPAFDIGRKAAATSLADIAAMGAVPTALVVAFAAPGEVEVSWAIECMRGLSEEAGALGAAIVGGDIVSASTITISVTAIGETQGRVPVLRSGARPGDSLALAGRVGWAAAGLDLLNRGLRTPRALVEAQFCPEPPYAAGPAAAVAGATALIDVSDGLISEARHLAVSSGVVIEIRTADWEIPGPLATAARALNRDPRQWMLTGGEDHCLLAAFPAACVIPPAFTRIGQVASASGRDPGVRVDGDWVAGQGGFDHFN